MSINFFKSLETFLTPFGPCAKDENSFILSTKLEKRSEHSDVGYITNRLCNVIKDTGSYIIIVNDMDNNGPNAVFCISKSYKNQIGNVNVLSQSFNLNGDSLTIQWNEYEYPLLIYRKNILNISKTQTYTEIYFVVKVITSF
jgi:hypothetical protein